MSVFCCTKNTGGACPTKVVNTQRSASASRATPGADALSSVSVCFFRNVKGAERLYMQITTTSSHSGKGTTLDSINRRCARIHESTNSHVHMYTFCATSCPRNGYSLQSYSILTRTVGDELCQVIIFHGEPWLLLLGKSRNCLQRGCSRIDTILRFI